MAKLLPSPRISIIFRFFLPSICECGKRILPEKILSATYGLSAARPTVGKSLSACMTWPFLPLNPQISYVEVIIFKRCICILHVPYILAYKTSF